MAMSDPIVFLGITAGSSAVVKETVEVRLGIADAFKRSR